MSTSMAQHDGIVVMSWPVCMRSQVSNPTHVTKSNMEAMSQLLSLKKPLKYSLYLLKSDVDYFMQKSQGLC